MRGKHQRAADLAAVSAAQVMRDHFGARLEGLVSEKARLRLSEDTSRQEVAGGLRMALGRAAVAEPGPLARDQLGVADRVEAAPPASVLRAWP
jgi:hypothetical protein